ncbi:MAG: S-methyl-5-thioribose kinase [Firmicutes bacterium HGW-Firmicutes-7]|nr:MAG: S-methyl-5-thioribose kinase [Firmicutes bacterium HGW-Firmicutes-7]
MNNYSEHFLMNTEDVKEYAKMVLKYFEMDERLEASEIGDGNINYVFKIWNSDTGKSLIIKQADRLLRSSGRPLDMHRNKIEAEILSIERELAHSYVPTVYNYDEVMYAMAMEDISAYKNLRTELMKGKIFDHFSDNISTFLVNTLLPTTDLILDRAKKKERVKLFINPELCDISEDLVFTEPYNDYKKQNVIPEGNLEFVKKMLYNDEELKAEVGILRDGFMNHAQALIHGDLHSGSIFANEEGIKIIDPEFAFYGPMGYDVGNVIGNLFFTWINKFFVEPDNQEFLSWIEKTIVEVVDSFVKKFSRKYDEEVTFDLYKIEEFKKYYIERVLSDSIGYAGTEIIRRVVGDSKVVEVTSVTYMNERIAMERVLIKAGITFIKNRDQILTGTTITNIVKKLLVK